MYPMSMSIARLTFQRLILQYLKSRILRPCTSNTPRAPLTNAKAKLSEVSSEEFSELVISAKQYSTRKLWSQESAIYYLSSKIMKVLTNCRRKDTRLRTKFLTRTCWRCACSWICTWRLLLGKWRLSRRSVLNRSGCRWKRPF